MQPPVLCEILDKQGRDEHVGVSVINCITKNLKHGEVDCTSFIDGPGR